MKRSLKLILLVAHNATFDVLIFLRSIPNVKMIDNFNIICGFSDTLKFFKKTFPERKDPEMFKLAKLAEDLLETQVSENFFITQYLMYTCYSNLFNLRRKKKNCYTIVIMFNQYQIQKTENQNINSSLK